MSDSDKIDVWSSWHVIQGDLRSVIETRNSNGALLSLGSTPDNLILKQPGDDAVTCCQLHVDTTKLTGYYLRGIAVTSEARNVEVYYDSGEYIGTAGRSVLQNTDNDKAYLPCCTYELDYEIIISRLLLKLLSLRGKDQIRITKIALLLMENYGRGEEQEQMGTTWPDEMTPTSLAVIHNLPPFVQSIVNDLHSGPSPDEMNKLIVMLRQARVAKEEEERKAMERQNKEMERENEEMEDDKRESEDTTVPLVSADDSANGDPLTALEMKLKQFITDQLTLLEQRLDTKLNSLVKRLDNLECLNNK